MKKFKFTISGNNYNVEIKNFENNIAEIEINGTSYKIELDKEIKTSKTPKLIRSDVASKQETIPLKRSSDLAVIKSPLPGSILQIFVKKDDTVKKGDTLLILEAMKMENNILAEKSGTIKSINCSVGDNVLQGVVLVEIE
jgi:biotin carboxyl carrier protein